MLLRLLCALYTAKLKLTTNLQYTNIKKCQLLKKKGKKKKPSDDKQEGEGT